MAYHGHQSPAYDDHLEGQYPSYAVDEPPAPHYARGPLPVPGSVHQDLGRQSAFSPPPPQMPAPDRHPSPYLADPYAQPRPGFDSHLTGSSGYSDPFNDPGQQQSGDPVYDHDALPLMNEAGAYNGATYNAEPQPGSNQYDSHPQDDDQTGHYAPGGFVDPQEDVSMVRYGKIPSRQPRRFKTIKRVELYQGNLVLDCAVPDKLLQMCANKTDREMTHMRYTAATCDPNDFKDQRYTLRQLLYPRRTELFIVVTLYNEDDVLFTRTMHSVMKNIAHLCKRDRSKTWGKDGWKKVVVCVVADGRSKINSRTLSVLAAMGVYQEGVAKNVVNGKPVTAHIYEYTTQISVDSDLQPHGSEKGVVPVQILFCLKEKNQKKINSHRWFFNAFADVLAPNVCILLDGGTAPGPTSIYHLWKAFDVNSNVAGACGEIVALKGKYYSNLFNPLVAAQNFEYKMSNILDKPTESVFGYISVLPGAFSAYRYIALQNDVNGHGPLSEYFKGETLHTSPDTDLWTKNMYLAEDRILCWELVSKRDSQWLLHYVKSAYAVTDVPDTLPELISQRRRWLNGSFFAAIHSVVHFSYLYRSSHSFMRKFWLHIEVFYTSFNMIFAWFALANWYISFKILTTSLEDDSFGLNGIQYFNIVLGYVYLALLIMCFLLAMGNRPQGSNKTFTTAVVVFALITLYMTFAAIFLAAKGIINVKNASEAGGQLEASDVFQNPIFRNIVLSLVATFGLYFIASLMFFDPWHMITSFGQYLLMAPSYTNIINVYAFCNVHDVSWGTKGDNTVELDLGVVKGKDNAVEVNVPADSKDIDDAYDDAWAVLSKKPPVEKATVDAETRVQDSYKNIRTNVVMAWAISNGALVAGILSTGAGANISADGGSSTVSIYMAILLYSVAGLAAIRFIGAAVYLVGWLFTG